MTAQELSLWLAKTCTEYSAHYNPGLKTLQVRFTRNQFSMEFAISEFYLKVDPDREFERRLDLLKTEFESRISNDT